MELQSAPPRRARIGVKLYPPIAVSLSSESDTYDELSHIWASVSLVNSHTGLPEEYVTLRGNKVDSAHPFTHNTPSGSSSSSTSGSGNERAYFYFHDLEIPQLGRYRIRVSLMKIDYTNNPEYGENVVLDYIDSEPIDMYNTPVPSTSLRKLSKSWLSRTS